jgi:hypothetical protein
LPLPCCADRSHVCRHPPYDAQCYADIEASREEAEVHVFRHRNSKARHTPTRHAGRPECHALLSTRRRAVECSPWWLGPLRLPLPSPEGFQTRPSASQLRRRAGCSAGMAQHPKWVLKFMVACARGFGLCVAPAEQAYRPSHEQLCRLRPACGMQLSSQTSGCVSLFCGMYVGR